MTYRWSWFFGLIRVRLPYSRELSERIREEIRKARER